MVCTGAQGMSLEPTNEGIITENGMGPLKVHEVENRGKN